jgi:hypothetical protein
MLDSGANSDIGELLAAMAVVSAGILILASALPGLLAAEERGSDHSARIISSLVVDGVLDLRRAEGLAGTMGWEAAIRVVAPGMDGIQLLESEWPDSAALHVRRTPVLVHSLDRDFPAMLEVTCAA